MPSDQSPSSSLTAAIELREVAQVIVGPLVDLIVAGPTGNDVDTAGISLVEVLGLSGFTT